MASFTGSGPASCGTPSTSASWILVTYLRNGTIQNTRFTDCRARLSVLKLQFGARSRKRPASTRRAKRRQLAHQRGAQQHGQVGENDRQAGEFGRGRTGGGPSDAKPVGEVARRERGPEPEGEQRENPRPSERQDNGDERIRTKLPRSHDGYVHYGRETEFHKPYVET